MKLIESIDTFLTELGMLMHKHSLIIATILWFMALMFVILLILVFAVVSLYVEFN